MRGSLLARIGPSSFELVCLVSCPSRDIREVFLNFICLVEEKWEQFEAFRRFPVSLADIFFFGTDDITVFDSFWLALEF